MSQEPVSETKGQPHTFSCCSNHVAPVVNPQEGESRLLVGKGPATRLWPTSPFPRKDIDLLVVSCPTQMGSSSPAAKIRVSTSKPEMMFLGKKKVECPLQLGSEVLPQVEAFKYLRDLFTSEGRVEQEINR